MKLKGKPLTLGAKIVAVLVALMGLVAKGLWPSVVIPYDDVLKAAGFIVLVFGPIDVSLWLENIFQKKPVGVSGDSGEGAAP